MPQPGRRSILLALLLIAVATSEATQAQSMRLKERMSAAVFEKCGLQKLTPAELAALEEWLSHQAGGGIPSSASVIQRLQGSAEQGRSTEMVSFNTSSRKYHCATCTWALRCTKNCISIPLAEARQRGVPCSGCGGSCR